MLRRIILALIGLLAVVNGSKWLFDGKRLPTLGLGYLVQCDPYQGACETYGKELGVGASVILDLVSKLPPDVPFKIYCDRFFSSVKLAEILKSKEIGYTGTIKSNRTEKSPLIDSKEMAKRPRGSFDFCLEQGEGIALTTWNDNTVVLLVSAVDPVMPIVKATRWIAKDAQKKKPLINLSWCPSTTILRVA